MNDAERLWAKIKKTDGCWLWTGCRMRAGYGQIRRGGRTAYVHRMAWELERGPIPKGMMLRHHCGSLICCNPDHLSLGRGSRDILPLDQSLAKHCAMSGDGCWEWTGPRANSGYGFVTRGHGSKMLAHRASWVVAHGDIPDGLCVLHRCDNRLCVRPDHLFLGTRTDNSDDKLQKERHVRKDDWRNGYGRLTAEDVRAIRARYRSHDRKNGAAALAKEYQVTPGHISDIIRGRVATHIS